MPPIASPLYLQAIYHLSRDLNWSWIELSTPNPGLFSRKTTKRYFEIYPPPHLKAFCQDVYSWKQIYTFAATVTLAKRNLISFMSFPTIFLPISILTTNVIRAKVCTFKWDLYFSLYLVHEYISKVCNIQCYFVTWNLIEAFLLSYVPQRPNTRFYNSE